MDADRYAASEYRTTKVSQALHSIREQPCQNSAGNRRNDEPGAVHAVYLVSAPLVPIRDHAMHEPEAQHREHTRALWELQESATVPETAAATRLPYAKDL